MTQVTTLSATPNQQIDFELEILRPNGQSYIPKRIFNDSKLENVGLDDGIDSVIERGGACKSVTFSGRKDMIGCEGGEIVRFRVNDGYDWRYVGFGAITTGHPSRDLFEGANYDDDGSLLRQYTASTDVLLRRSVITGTETYPPQDIGALLRQLVSLYRHPALGYDSALIPNLGVSLTEPFCLPAANFLQVFEQLAKKVEEVNGVAVAYGVRGDGNVFFRFPTGNVEIPFDPATYRELPVDANDLCTAVMWEIGNEPSVSGWGGDYMPGELAHLSIPDASLHGTFHSPIGLQAQEVSRLDLYYTVALASYSHVGFTNPENAVNTGTDGYALYGDTAYRSATTGDPEFRITAPIDNRVCGVRIRYRMDTNNRLARLYVYQAVRKVGTTDTKNVKAVYNLPYTDGVYLTKDYLFPKPKSFVDDGGSWEPYSGSYVFSAIIFNVGIEGYFAISDFRFFRLATEKLDIAARSELKTPATNPAQLSSTYLRDGLPVGLFIPGVTADILHTNRPDGTKTLPISEIRHSYNAVAKYQCRVDVGNPSRQGLDATLERVASGIERRAQESELKTGGRL